MKELSRVVIARRIGNTVDDAGEIGLFQLQFALHFNINRCGEIGGIESEEHEFRSSAGNLGVVILVGFNGDGIAFELGDKSEETLCWNRGSARFGDFSFDPGGNAQFQIGGCHCQFAVRPGFNEDIGNNRHRCFVADNVANLLQCFQESILLYTDFHD